MIPTKTSARLIGGLFLAAVFAYGVGNMLVESSISATDYLTKVSEHQMQLRIGALLMILNSIVVLSIGVLIFPVLKKYNESIALAYAATRIIEATILLVGIINLLTLIPVSREYVDSITANTTYLLTMGDSAIRINYYAYQIAMMILGLGSVLFCYLLIQSALIPKTLAVWGIIGYAIFFSGAILELLDISWGLTLSIPAGLFELTFGIWLLIRGFSVPGSTEGQDSQIA